MAFDAHANFAYSTVAVAPVPAASGGSLEVAAGTGALFPAAPFNAVVWPLGALPLSTNAEVVRVTARAGDVLTITRTQEGSSARSIGVGDQIADAITAKTLTDIETAVTALQALFPIVNANVDAAAAIALSKLALLPACKVRRSTNQTLTTAVNTAISFDTELIDTDGMHDNAVNPTRVTFQRDGLFLCIGSNLWAANAAGIRQNSIVLNGATAIDADRRLPTGADDTYNKTTILHAATAGDYIELFCVQTSGGNLAVRGVADYSPLLTAFYVGHT